MVTVEGRDQSWVEVCVAMWKTFCNLRETRAIVSPGCRQGPWSRHMIEMVLIQGGCWRVEGQGRQGYGWMHIHPVAG